MPSDQELVRALLDRYPRSYGEEVGVDVASGRPSALFRLLTASLLFSARISADIAVAAAKALADEGLTTAERMAEATWSQRVHVLNRSGYARYDERTSSMLGETSDLLMARYHGDLRRLRDEAGRDPAEERRLLKQFKGLGDVGVDIFFREAQAAWGELRPFVDGKARTAARRLGLPEDPEQIAGLVRDQDLPRLLSALVRTDLHDAYDEVAAAASGGEHDEGGSDGEASSSGEASRGGDTTKQELYERARDLGVEGRSQMRKKELAQAVRRQA